MLTLFTVPKPFRGHIGIIQRNAIQSWMRLNPRPEILLLGKDEGVDEVAREFGLGYVPDLALNAYGTPRLDDVFVQAERNASHAVLGYVNADIILLSDLAPALRAVRAAQPAFLLIGQRLNCPVPEPLDFQQSDWEVALREHVRRNGALHDQFGMDYFVFTRGALGALLPLTLGRCVWDNWLVLHARQRGLPVVDATHWVTVVHQNHDYAHGVAAGAENPRHAIWHGPEAQENRRLLGALPSDFGVRDADWRIDNWTLRRVPLAERWRRDLAVFDALHPQPSAPERLWKLGLQSWLSARTVAKRILTGRRNDE